MSSLERPAVENYIAKEEATVPTTETAASDTMLAGEIAARLDRLPVSRHMWKLVILLSLGGLFEYYDIFFTGYAAPGMLQAGLFSAASLGPFAILGLAGISGFGTFVFATFAGLWVGTLVLGFIADRFGRRTIFTYSLLWYSICTFIMGWQSSGFEVVLWRFISGIGIGAQLVTIDAYITELVPRTQRGRAYAVCQLIDFTAVPIVALLAWLLVPQAPFGVQGWRWVVIIGSVGAIFVWWIRRDLPESPRWLANHGRAHEALEVLERIEAQVAKQTGSLPLPDAASQTESGTGSLSEIWGSEYRSRTIMLSVFNFFQAIGVYGFAAWIPTLLVAKGITITHSLEYAFYIALANPVGPLLGLIAADRIERKWQICTAATFMGALMLLFALQTNAAILILIGMLFTLSQNWNATAFRNYQSELFPTRVRSRAIGFVYSWSRLSAAFGGLLIGAFLEAGGEIGVALFIAGCMAMVVISIGVFGPLTRGRALEEIAH